MRAAFDQVRALVGRIAPSMVRLSLSTVFIWFGALKLTGHSPVAALIAATLPSTTPGAVLHVLGAFELVLGVGLLTGRAQRLLLFTLAGHLTGTFLAFVDAPRLMLQHRNPLLLSADGEFVLKNLVLISAAMLLIAHQGVRRPREVLTSTTISKRRHGTRIGRGASGGNQRRFEKVMLSMLLEPPRPGENKAQDSLRPNEAAFCHKCGTAAARGA